MTDRQQQFGVMNCWVKTAEMVDNLTFGSFLFKILDP